MFRNRWKILLYVDDQVDEVMKKRQDLLDDTFVLYTCDHGYHLGTYAMPIDKRLNYETDIRVPLLARGTEITPNQKVKDIISNIDITPSILEMAGETLAVADGISFLPLIQNSAESLDFNGPNIRPSQGAKDWDKNFITYFGSYLGPEKQEP